MEAAIKKALKDLAKSNTALRRKNARRRFRSAVNAFAREIDEKYPLLNGAAKRRGAYCYLCRQPYKSFKLLAAHFEDQHSTSPPASSLRGERVGFYPQLGMPGCTCGKRFKNLKGLAQHLARQPDLAHHLAQAELIRMSK